MRGTVVYANASRRFALIMPAGAASRDADIFASDVWWFTSGLGSPAVGQIIEFDVAPNFEGHVEAVSIRSPAAASVDGSCPSTPTS